MEHAESEVLLERSRAGDQEAIATLRAEYGDLIREVLHDYRDGPVAPNSRDLSELVQNGMIVTLRELDRLIDEVENIPAYLQVMAQHQGVGFYRHWTAQIRDTRRNVHDSAVVGGLAADGETPSEEAELHELKVLLDEEIARLDEKDRLILLARTEGQSWEAIRQRSGDPTADAARQRYARVVKRLREALGVDEPGDEE